MKTLECMVDGGDTIQIKRNTCPVGEVGLLMSGKAQVFVTAEDAIDFANTLIKAAKEEIKAEEAQQ